MAAMIGEIENDLDVIQFLNQSEDESSMDEMIRSTSGLFATLDKLTSEIVEDDLTSVEGGTSARSRSSAGSNSHESPTRNENDDDNNDDDDDDYYSDDDDGAYSDDEDPDSGETKLFSMMDELVAELQIQLEEDSDDDDNDNDDNNNDDNDKDKEDDETNASIVDGGKDNNGEGAVSNVNENTEHTSMAEAFTASATATVEDDDDDENNTEDDHRAEKQRHAELHQHVQTLLEQVVEMKMLFILDKTTTTTSSSSSSSARNKKRREDRCQHPEKDSGGRRLLRRPVGTPHGRNFRLRKQGCRRLANYYCAKTTPLRQNQKEKEEATNEQTQEEEAEGIRTNDTISQHSSRLASGFGREASTRRTIVVLDTSMHMHMHTRMPMYARMHTHTHTHTHTTRTGSSSMENIVLPYEC